MQSNNEQRLEAIQQKMLLTAMLDVPATLLVGLALYGRFVASGDAFLPLLNNGGVTSFMLGFGAAMMAWTAYRLLSLARQRQSLQAPAGPSEPSHHTDS